VTGQAHSATRAELGQHLLGVLEQQGLTIEAATAPGYPQPGRMRLGIRRARLRPDVVAHDGRRTVLGIALDKELIRAAYVPAELDAYAGTCRMLVICVTQESANQAIQVLFDKPVPNWRKMRLLRSPGERFEDVSRAANDRKLRDLVRAKRDTPVHVVSEDD
jgi:hypothetical protein